MLGHMAAWSTVSFPLSLHGHLFSIGFPPIPGLEPAVGSDEDALAATLAAAQKLTSEDTAAAEEDENEV